MTTTRIASAFVLAACAAAPTYVRYTNPNGAVRLDQDGDGFAGAWVCPSGVSGCDAAVLNAQPIADLDCDDANAARHPGAVDTPGDGIDQNCDGADGIAPPPEGAGVKLPSPPPKAPLTND